MRLLLISLLIVALFPLGAFAADKTLFTYRGHTAWYSVVILDSGERLEIKTPFKEVPKTGNVTALRIANKVALIKATAAKAVETEIKEIVK